MPSFPSFRKILFAFFAVVSSIGIINSYIVERYRPIHLVPFPQLPEFSDDLDTASLINCLKEQRGWLLEQDDAAVLVFGDEIFSRNRLVDSVDLFMQKLAEPDSGESIQSFISRHFHVYQAGGRKGKKSREMLITGYYEPVFHGSPTRTKPYIHPIYSPPPELVVKGGSENKRIGRLTPDGQFVDFWSRGEIETRGLLKGGELAWLRDPFDAYLLHVQGSGRLRFPDGSLHAVRYAGSNGLEYMSIGKLLVEEGIMSLEDVSVPAIRDYLSSHPEQRQKILHHNPRFIFFNWGDTQGPRGSSGRILTPGRSIAIDNSALPAGTIGFLISRKPLFDRNDNLLVWENLARFVCPQDTGAAIKGTGRVDIFWGNGKYAELAASHMKEPGSLYFLVKKL